MGSSEAGAGADWRNRQGQWNVGGAIEMEEPDGQARAVILSCPPRNGLVQGDYIRRAGKAFGKSYVWAAPRI